MTFKKSEFKGVNTVVMGTAKPEVHLMLMRAAEAGEIEVLVQMHADPTRNERDHEGLYKERESEAFHWALPSVKAEPAEALLIQTGQAHERLRAARRAALRAGLLFTSSAPVKQAACKAVSAVQIKIPMLQHHTRDEHKLPADPAVTAFGRLPPSLVRACSIYGQEGQQAPMEVMSPTAEIGRGAAVATRVFSADGAETAFTRLSPAPPLHLPFCAHSSGDAEPGDAQRVVGEAYGTRVNQRLPLLLLKRLGNDAAHTCEPQGGAGVNTWLPVVKHVCVIHCIFPEVDGAFATADWQWTPRAQATARHKVHEVNLLGVGRHQCRLGCTWTSLKGLILSGGAFIPHFNLGVSPILQQVISQHLQLITHIEVALAKESSWAALARREAAARQQRWRARGYFTQEKLAEAERRRLPPQYSRDDPRSPWWEPGSLTGTAVSTPGQADDQPYKAWPHPVAQQPQAIYSVLCLCMHACMHACVCMCMRICMYVWIYIVSRRPYCRPRTQRREQTNGLQWPTRGSPRGPLYLIRSSASSGTGGGMKAGKRAGECACVRPWVTRPTWIRLLRQVLRDGHLACISLPVCVRARAHARAIVYFTFCVYRRGLALAAAPAMARRPKLLAPGSRFGCLELGGCLWVRARSDCILTSRCMYARMSVFVVTCSNTLSTLTQRRWGVGVEHDVYIRIFTCNRVRSIRAPADVGRGIASYEACRIRLAPC